MDIRRSESLDFLLSDSYYIQERSNTLLSTLEELQHDIHTSSRISTSSSIGRMMEDSSSITNEPSPTILIDSMAADVTFDDANNVTNDNIDTNNDNDDKDSTNNDNTAAFTPVLIRENDDDIILISSPKSTTTTTNIQEIISIDSPKIHELPTTATSSVKPEILVSPTSKNSNGIHTTKKHIVTDGNTANLRGGPAPTKKMLQQQQQNKNALLQSKVTPSGSSTPSPKKASTPSRTSLSSPRTATMTTKTTSTGKIVTRSQIRPKVSSPTIVNAKSSPPLKNTNTTKTDTRKPISRTKSSPTTTSVKRGVTPAPLGRSKSIEKLPTSSLPRVALISSNKPKLKGTTAVEKGQWTPLPPVRKSKVIFTIPSTKAPVTSNNIENRTATPRRPPPTKGTAKMNPVLAERRANAAATSVNTPYKVSVTNAIINKKKIINKPKPLQQQQRTIQSLNKQFDASTSPTAVSLKMKKQNTSTTAAGTLSSNIVTNNFPRSSEWNDAMKCQKADKSYSKKLYMSFTKGTVMVMSSFLTKEEEMALQSLVTKTKSHTVKLLISDTFQRQKTSICVLPVAETLPEPTITATNCIVNTIADRRSMKAMEAMLHGIPIVTPEWISACMKEEKVILPTSSMYLRSLPSKTLVSEDNNDDDDNQNKNPAATTLSDFGIAFLSAAIDTTGGKYKPLAGVVEFVYLTGFSARKQGELCALVRDAGAKEVITKSLIAVERIKQLSNNSSNGAFVFLCNDTNVTFSQELEQSMKQYQKSKKRRSTNSIWIVNSNWLYDSITCGESLLSDASRSNPNYKPIGEKVLELWNSIMTISTAGGSNIDNTTIITTNGTTAQPQQHINDDRNVDTPADTTTNVDSAATIDVPPALDTSIETSSENATVMDDTTSEQHVAKPVEFV